MKHVKVKLLSDGGYDSLKSISFPVVVDGYLHGDDDDLAYVEARTLLELSAKASGSDYPFSIGYECEIINQTETPEEKEAFEAMGKKSMIDSWNAGDDCIFDNKPCLEFGGLTLEYLNKKAVIHHLFINSNSLKMALIEFDDGYCCAVVQDCLSKPETPQQREKRERIDAVAGMWIDSGNDIGLFERNPDLLANIHKDFLFKLYDAGYRKDSHGKK